MAEPTLQELEIIWLKCERLKKLSDRIISFGPFGGIGLDGLLAAANTPLSLLLGPLAAPLAALGIGVDELFTLGAGVYLFGLATKARASGSTITKMMIYIAVDFLLGLIPFVGGPLDFLFHGHVYAARALQKEIEARYPWPPKSA